VTAVKGFVAGVVASVAATVLANVMFTGVRWPSVADHFYAPRGKVMRVVGAAADVETARDKGQLSGTCKNTAAVAVVLDQDTAGKRQRFVLGAADCVGGKWALGYQTIVSVGETDIWLQAVSDTERRTLNGFGEHASNLWSDRNLPGTPLGRCSLTAFSDSSCSSP
jgi:hypothetical protein